jgi:serine protease Do
MSRLVKINGVSRRLAVMLVAVFMTASLGSAVTPIHAAERHPWTEQAPALPKTTVPAPDWVDIAKAVKPAVVNVSTKHGDPAKSPSGKGDDEGSLPDPFRQFPGRPGPSPRMLRGLGSGFVIDPSGYLVTNAHVVADASEIKVKMSDGREFDAKVVGRDAKTDIALLKIEASGLPVIPLGDSSALQVGEPVMAIGNPFGLEQTVTTGIVSATGRVIGEGPYDDFIQTDASINPGNSGGPLINARGQAVGINTAIFSRTGGSVGIGFAIPTSLAKSVVSQLASTGHVTRGWLGVTIQRLTPDLAKSFNLPEASGALVSGVSEGSPAAKAGLRQGDVIVSYHGRPVARSEDLPRVVADTPVGTEVPIVILRDGKKVETKVQVAKMPEEQVASAGEPSGTGHSLGVSAQTLTPELARQLKLDVDQGVLVRSVREDSRAAMAGIEAGDVIVAVDQKPVRSVEDMQKAFEQHSQGRATLVLVHRNGGNVYLTVGSS